MGEPTAGMLDAAAFNNALAGAIPNDPTPPTSPTPPATDAAPPATDAAPPADSTPPTPPAGSTPPAEPTPPTPDTSKANQAFAQMRTTLAQTQQQNQQLLGTIRALAAKANIPVDQTAEVDTLLQAIEAEVTKDKAKNMGVAPEVVTEMQRMQNFMQQIDAERKQQLVLQAFTDVMTQFQLTPQATYEFASQLGQSGIDVEQNLAALPALYRGFNHDALVKQAADKAVQEALTRNNKAATYSTTPAQLQGAGAPLPDDKMKTMAELDAALKGVGDNKT